MHRLSQRSDLKLVGIEIFYSLLCNSYVVLFFINASSFPIVYKGGNKR